MFDIKGLRTFAMSAKNLDKSVEFARHHGYAQTLFGRSRAAFIGKEAGANWESWKEHLHYVDYVVIVAIALAAVWLFVRYRRRRAAGAAVDAA